MAYNDRRRSIRDDSSNNDGASHRVAGFIHLLLSFIPGLGGCLLLFVDLRGMASAGLKRRLATLTSLWGGVISDHCFEM